MSQLLEDRIRTSLRAAADRLTDAPIVAAEAIAQKRTSRFPGPAIAAAAMLAVLLIVGGSVLFLSSDGMSGTDVLGGDSIDPFPVTSFVPKGIETVEGGFIVPDPSAPATVNASVARTTENGFRDSVWIVVHDSSDTSGYERGEPVTVNGQEATLLVDSGLTGTTYAATVWWVDNDVTVWVSATNSDADLALAVAEAVELGEGSPLSAEQLQLGPLPAGFTVLAPPALASTDPQPYLGMFGQPSLEHPEPFHASVVVAAKTVGHALAGAGSITETTVRGHDGYLKVGDGGSALVWEEAPGATVTVGGTFPEEEIRKIAESLDFVSESEWRATYDVDDSALEPSTTTTSLATHEPTEPEGGTQEPVEAPNDGPTAPTTTVF
ncbi:MAG: hypothetical protein WBN35_07920 [Acidimicrobiia bacterium]